jgi:phage N-6-adenine-methyltransferase
VKLYRALDKIYEFKADIAASDQWHLHPVYYSAKNSAFNHNWSLEIPGAVGGYVFINHPYSDTERWMRKAVTEVRRGVGVVMLAKAPAAEAYWSECVDGKASELIFLTGRLRFGHPETGVPTKGCNFASVVVVWDPFFGPERGSPDTRVRWLEKSKWDSLYLRLRGQAIAYHGKLINAKRIISFSPIDFSKYTVPLQMAV